MTLAAKFIDIRDFNERQEREALARELFYSDVDSGIVTVVRDWTSIPHMTRVRYRQNADRVWLERKQKAVQYDRVIIPGLRPTHGPVIAYIGHEVRP